ncbi:MAG: hypothetical protein JXR03_21685, partial [Cyclobacteriaceae bacterium]
SIVRQTPIDEFTNVVGGTGVVFTATFNEPVNGVDISDFVIGAGPTGSTITGFNAVSTTVYEVTVTGYSDDGGLNIDFSGGQNITDIANNSFVPGTGITGEENYVIDLTQPTVVLSSNDADAIVKDADLVTITATFVETNSIAADPTLSISGGLVTNAA